MTLATLVAELRAIDPRLPYLLTAALCGVLVWLWKTLSPKTFEQVPPRARALPAAAIGAILTAGSTESLHTLLVDLVFGAFAGVTAVGGHETLRRLALGPQEATASPVPLPTPPAPVQQPAVMSDAEFVRLLGETKILRAVVDSLPAEPPPASPPEPAALVYGKAEKTAETPPATPPEPGDPATE